MVLEPLPRCPGDGYLQAFNTPSLHLIDTDGRGVEQIDATGVAIDGMPTLHRIHAHEFPTVFVVGPTQGTNLILNIPHNLVDADDIIETIGGYASESGADEVEVTAKAEDDWITLWREGGRHFGEQPDCTPGYYNNEGKLLDGGGQLNGLGYPDRPVAFFEYIEPWRNLGRFDGLNLRVR